MTVRVQLPALAGVFNTKSIIQVFLNSDRLVPVTISLRTVFQRPATALVENLFLMYNLLHLHFISEILLLVTREVSSAPLLPAVRELQRVM